MDTQELIFVRSVRSLGIGRASNLLALLAAYDGNATKAARAEQLALPLAPIPRGTFPEQESVPFVLTEDEKARLDREARETFLTQGKKTETLDAVIGCAAPSIVKGKRGRPRVEGSICGGVREYFRVNPDHTAKQCAVELSPRFHRPIAQIVSTVFVLTRKGQLTKTAHAGSLMTFALNEASS